MFIIKMTVLGSAAIVGLDGCSLGLGYSQITVKEKFQTQEECIKWGESILEYNFGRSYSCEKTIKN